MYLNFLYVFGAIIIAAGLQGFLKGSKISLIAAGILGGCVLAGAFLLGSKTTLALVLVLVGAFGITGRFLPAFLKAKDKGAALWPAGILAVLGVVALVWTVMFLVR